MPQRELTRVIELSNYVGGSRIRSRAREHKPVHNPATGELLGWVPLSPPEEVDRAVNAAVAAFAEWRRRPPTERVQHLFRLKTLLEENLEELARLITLENGKTLQESRQEMRRAIDNVEVACGIPSLMQGAILEDAAKGIDEYMIRQPVGVCAMIVPFNFPGMIPFWFLPYAVATGNTCVLKPSERTPLTMNRVFDLFEKAGFPPGVLNMVQGDAGTVRSLLEHPQVQAVSFVGSTPAARQVYAQAAAHGKRVQASGGAKNPVIILPDADLERTASVVAESAFGNAGQRCLACSVAITVGEAGPVFAEAMTELAQSRRVGSGLDADVEMGPVISLESKQRIESLISLAEQEGARVKADGRNTVIPGLPKGNFIRPTILTDLPPAGEVAKTEIFGPVLGLVQVQSIEEAIRLVNSGSYGNMACLFTSSGSAARRFRYEAEAGNIGINVGVAAPLAFFPFSGWKESFFGILHGQGAHAVEFFTQTKVIVERWP